MQGLIINSPNSIKLNTISHEKNLEPNDVKIELIYGGICGSDLGVYKGKITHAKYPVVPGHELLGHVIDTGENVKQMLDKRVVVGPNTFCGTCSNCQKGKTNICLNKESLGVNKDGGFAQQFTIDSKYVLEIPDQLSDERAVLIEPLSVVVHAVSKINKLENKDVAVIGCGTEGLFTVALADYLGANVTAVDINEEKLNKIREYYPNVKTSLTEDLPNDTFDHVIEAAGVKAAVEAGVKALKPGGSIVIIGFAPVAELEIIKIVRKELTIYGSIIYDFPKDFEASLKYLLNDSFNVEPVISKVLPFGEYEKAYQDALSGQYGKIILDFKEE